jgi:hypothetical protein
LGSFSLLSLLQSLSPLSYINYREVKSSGLPTRLVALSPHPQYFPLSHTLYMLVYMILLFCIMNSFYINTKFRLAHSLRNTFCRTRIPCLGYFDWLHCPQISPSLSYCSHLEHRASVKRFVSIRFLNPKTVGRTPWTGDHPVARPLPIETQNKHRQTSMPSVGFERTIPAFERTKTFHALDCEATVIGVLRSTR